MSMSSRPPVVIIGAGLAGLACAADLTTAGIPVQVLEASDGVGGRMRTDRRAGFLLDRGFQVFNTSYPQVQRRIDLRALQLRAFTPGVLLHTAARRLRFADPTRNPRRMADLLLGRLARPRDVAVLAALSAGDLLLPARMITRQPDRTTLAALAEAGISSDLTELFFRPFLAGVFLEDELETSGRFFHLVWRSMLRGTLCLPRHGMQAVPAQLAAVLPPPAIRLETPVSALTDDGVALADGTELGARAVVVATGAAAAAVLLPGLAIPGLRTVTTLYHAAPVPPLAEPILLVDTERKILNTAVLTQVTPGYGDGGGDGGDGRALVSTSVLGDRPGDGAGDQEPEVRSRLAELYRTDTTGWEHLATYTVAGALPAMVPPHPLSLPCRISARRYVCGDHRATGSVQGALASGTRAAREILAQAS
jgi:glycine/D-amino acid oxidase-like deaminating enzyme